MSASKWQTIGDRIQFWGKTDPETPAFIFWSERGTRELTRGDVLDLSSRFAYRLTRCGVQPGDVVCISLPNCPERLVAEFGVQLAGAVSMNGQVLRADGEDLIVSMIKAECKCIIVDPNQRKGAWGLIKPHFDEYTISDDLVDINSKRIPSLKSAILSSARLLTDLKGYGSTVRTKVDPESRAVIFTTSGSTGYSKLVEHSDKGLFSFAESLPFESGSSTTYLNCSPLGWLGGYPIVFLAHGCKRVLIDDRFEVSDKAAAMWRIISETKIDAALLMPVMLNACPENIKSAGKKNLHVMTGGQPMKAQHLEGVNDFAEKVSIVYASTEAGGITLLTIDSNHLEKFSDSMAGYPFPGVEIKIVGKEDKPLPFMSKGEVLVKSPGQCLSIIGTESKDFLPDGWFRSGDVGYLREDGCLFVEGRSSDAIMHGAYILYPSWWEQKLVNCPGVKEVVIVPVPDKILHHEICACVKLDDASDVKPSSEDISSFCKQQTVLDESSHLSIIPRYVLFFDDFPKTNTDKIHRRYLADMASAKLGLA